ncbi:MAG: type II secretion system F family protein [Candidatus Woesearchaeota archaeon]
MKEKKFEKNKRKKVLKKKARVIEKETLNEKKEIKNSIEGSALKEETEKNLEIERTKKEDNKINIEDKKIKDDYISDNKNKIIKKGILLGIKILKKPKKKKEVKKDILYERREKKKIDKRETNIRKLLKNYTLKAGIEAEPEIIRKKIFDISLFVTAFISIILLFRLTKTGISFVDAAKFLVISWFLILLASIGICWLLFFIYVDIKIYKRKVEIENVLADFLQLTSANVRAGMPIDKALWYSIRPRFGVLAKEMETVAKETMSGVSLEEALTRFSEKYDSAILKNSISLLIEGINAGGEVGYILDRISNNIKETYIIKREMAANVITYVIFITFASILAAPFLMALSYQLLTIINTLGAQMSTEQVPNTMGLSISFSNTAISTSDFKLFAILVLSMTAMFSAMIISIIQKGTIKAGLKLIPTYILISIILFLILTRIVASFFNNLF